MSVSTSPLLELLSGRELPRNLAGVGNELPAPTVSADLRHSGYKLVPVDVNMFPAGWHNLCPVALPEAGRHLRSWATQRGLVGDRVLVLAELMTRNAPYIENLMAIGVALRSAGYEVAYAAYGDDMAPAGEAVTSLSGQVLRLEPMVVIDGRIETKAGLRPDWVLSNNDFTSGVPKELLAATTPVAPHPGLGWHSRLKRSFFESYEKVARKAAALADLDPWILIPETVAIEGVDFWQEVGLEAVADEVDAMLARIAAEYKQRGIADTPFVVVKDEAGTFGMGVVTLDSSASIRNPNRKLRQKMQRGKGGRPISSVLVQEGVYTRDVVGNCTAEPVVMAVGGAMIGGFYRYHCSRTETENLNAKGMVFAKMCSTPPAGTATGGCGSECIRDQARDHAYGWVAELVAAASGLEAAAVRQ